MTELKVKCVFCGLIIECKSEDTAQLLQHLRRDHPERAMEFHTPKKPTEPAKPKYNAPREESDASSYEAEQSEADTETEELLRRVERSSKTVDRYSSNSVSSDDSNHASTIVSRRSQTSLASQKSVLYQTSIRSWRPGRQTIRCPNCGAKRIPIARSHSNSVTWSSAMASCLWYCWPLCCLTWLLPEPSDAYLHCSHCDQLLTEHENEPVGDQRASNSKQLHKAEEELTAPLFECTR